MQLKTSYNHILIFLSALLHTNLPLSAMQERLFNLCAQMDDDVHAVNKIFDSHGIDINAKNKNGHAPLLIASQNCNENIMALLIKKKADVETHDRYGYTPLHQVIVSHWLHKNRRLACIKLLLAASANINTINGVNETPLYKSSQPRYADKTIITLLLNNKADVTIGDYTHDTPLHNITLQINFDLIALLIAHNANVNAINKHGLTPLHIAAKHSAFKAVETLIQHSADIEALDNLGYTPLFYANNKTTNAQALSINAITPLHPHQRIDQTDKKVSIVYLLHFATADSYYPIYTNGGPRVPTITGALQKPAIAVPDPITDALYQAYTDKQDIFRTILINLSTHPDSSLPMFPETLTSLIISYIMRAPLPERPNPQHALTHTQRQKKHHNTCCEIM